jgi:hypothetical protein
MPSLRGDRSMPADEYSDPGRFPAMRLLRDRAAALVVSKRRLRMLEQQLRQEELDRFDRLCTAEWRGKNVGAYEHLQGRVGPLTYHFIFATVDGQPTGAALRARPHTPLAATHLQ